MEPQKQQQNFASYSIPAPVPWFTAHSTSPLTKAFAVTHYLARHLSPFSMEGLSASPQRDFPAPRLTRRTRIRINTSLKLRARNAKELFGSKIMNMENQTRPGQEASRSRCFQFRTPRGSVKLSLGSGRERHERCDLECESQVFNVLKSPDTWYCAV